METPKIEVLKDGPYLVTGAVELLDADEQPIEVKTTKIALCRCGRSAEKPFCDGTHRKSGWTEDTQA
ncbi:MAG: CDGSH iron-sulfur domain-containing protein [Chthonomonadales bacterium]|nr:CDGSH iron-sulfur domain-containing protein [Chthonomonadales bacterium]